MGKLCRLALPPSACCCRRKYDNAFARGGAKNRESRRMKIIRQQQQPAGSISDIVAVGPETQCGMHSGCCSRQITTTAQKCRSKSAGVWCSERQHSVYTDSPKIQATRRKVELEKLPSALPESDFYVGLCISLRVYFLE